VAVDPGEARGVEAEVGRVDLWLGHRGHDVVYGMRAIQIQAFGGPEVLVERELPDPQPGDGTVVIDVTAAGINYADTHQAEDSYLAPQQLPMVPGTEVAGTTPDGRRVVALVAGGGYASKALAAEALTFEIPGGISDGQALALVVQGTTAWHLLRTSAQMRAGESVVVHAAAGGVGTLAVQLARRFGAGRVIGVASSEEKRALAARLGADAVVDVAAEDLTAALREANGGARVDIVLEMVGGSVFAASLAALAPFGRLVHFGQAGREGAPRLDPGKLMVTSTGVLGFWLVHLLRRPDLIAEAMHDMFDAVLAGSLEPVVGGTYPLAEARRAHEDIRSRGTVGKLVLTP
jgi:NADPH2:quinone reductase